MRQQYWNSVINAHWSALQAGRKVWLDVHPIFAPMHCGFRGNVGWPDGQTSDYTLSYSDGSRLHAQIFGARGGLLRVRLHLDRYDPDRSSLHFVLHGLLETPVGPALLGMLLVGAIATVSSS